MRIVFLILAALSFQTQAQESRFNSRSMGHLVTSNNNTLKKGEVGIGTLYAAYGISDQWTFGTSPFAYFMFDMYNFQSRWAWKLNKDEKFGFEFEYFKTYKKEPANYQEYGDGSYNFQMEAWDTKWTYTRQILPYYRFNSTASYYYYIDDTRPFSLRMDPQNSDRYAINLTTLHEFQINRNAYFNVELGLWGMNYTYPYYHVGASLDLQNDSFLFGFGMSSTFSPSFPAEKAKWFAGYDSTASFHPELQIEAFF
jgi:hypothetical protein